MPKTIKNVYFQNLSYEKLMQAHLKCEKGKKSRLNVIKFNLKKEEYIMWLYNQLKEKKYRQGEYKVFYVTKPKLRKIEAARYIDRIVHRWIFDNFLEPIFVPQFIPTSYACLKGKGMHRAAFDVQKAMKICKKKYGEYYILKMDIAKYFQSIDKDILMQIINRKIKDPNLLELLKQTIFNGRNEAGIPIRKSN